MVYEEKRFFIMINMIHYQHIVFVTGSTIWKKGHH